MEIIEIVSQQIFRVKKRVKGFVKVQDHDILWPKMINAKLIYLSQNVQKLAWKEKAVSIIALNGFWAVR